MNRLPAHRSALTGRTFDRSWSASDYDPVQRYSRQIVKWSDIGIAVLFVAVMVAIAAGVL